MIETNKLREKLERGFELYELLEEIVVWLDGLCESLGAKRER